MYFELRIWRFRWKFSFAYEGPEPEGHEEPATQPTVGFFMSGPHWTPDEIEL